MTDFASEPSISLVMPTRGRPDSAVERVNRYLQEDLIDEIIVVIDEPDLNLHQRLRLLSNRRGTRVTVLLHKESRGPGPSRNEGVKLVQNDLILLVDDDDDLSPQYLSTCLEAMLIGGFDVVAGPWLHGKSIEGICGEALRARNSNLPPRIDEVGRFPSGSPVLTPWLPGTGVLIRRSVFQLVQYRENLGPSSYRDETLFFIECLRQGFRVALISSVYSFKVSAGMAAGGIAKTGWRRRLRYEAGAWVNTWRMLMEHGSWLRSSGHLDRAPALEFVKFARRRVKSLISGKITSTLRG